MREVNGAMECSMRKGTRKRVRGLIKRGHTALQCGGMETRASQRHVPCRDRPGGARWHRVWNRYGRAPRLQEGLNKVWSTCGGAKRSIRKARRERRNVGHNKCKDTDG